MHNELSTVFPKFVSVLAAATDKCLSTRLQNCSRTARISEMDTLMRHDNEQCFPDSSEGQPPVSDLQLQRNCGTARIGFTCLDGKTALSDCFASAPLKWFFPRSSEDVKEAVVANVSGGIAGADQLELQINSGEATNVSITSQAAEKIYSALDTPARIRTKIRVGERGCFEWLPQETIVFDGARLDRLLEVDFGPGATALLAEIVVLGRTAYSEQFRSGHLLDRWSINSEGSPVWRDAFEIDNSGAISKAAGMAGRSVIATLVYAGPDAPKHLDALRELASQTDGMSGATSFRGILLARFLASEAGRFKAGFARMIGELRSRLLGRAAQAPRVWYC